MPGFPFAQGVLRLSFPFTDYSPTRASFLDGRSINFGAHGISDKELGVTTKTPLARSDCLAGSRQEEPSTKDENLKAFVAHDQRKFQCSNVSCLDDCETFKHAGSANDQPVAYIHSTIPGLRRIHDHSYTSSIFKKIIYFLYSNRP
jgi:hypothetical protein